MDRKALSREARHETNIFKSHVKILLKVLNFWKLRFNDKCAEWNIDADEAFATRRRAQNDFVDDNEANDNVVDSDGFQSRQTRARPRNRPIGRVYRSVGTASPETGHCVGFKSVDLRCTSVRVRYKIISSRSLRIFYLNYSMRCRSCLCYNRVIRHSFM